MQRRLVHCGGVLIAVIFRMDYTSCSFHRDNISVENVQHANSAWDFYYKEETAIVRELFKKGSNSNEEYFHSAANHFISITNLL
jgi:hypothetical protein